MLLVQDSSFFVFFILVIAGLTAWFGTRFIYDLVSKIFVPAEPERQPLNEKPSNFRKGHLIYQDPDSGQAIYRDALTGEDYIQDTIVVRGGKGNPKLLEFTSYEKRE